MKYYSIPETDLRVSRIIMGCMRIGGLTGKELESLIKTYLDKGVNFFDHADIYGGGECENAFGKAVDLKSSIRDRMIIQGKCAIRKENGKSYYDFSKAHILSSVDAILERLKTDYLDVLLLHRPDSLMEPAEVAEAFCCLKDSGKVRYFGLSNSNPMQIELLKKFVKQPLVINQVQLSLEQSQLIDQALYMNNKSTDFSINRDGNALDYCRLKDITIQAWSPLQFGMFGGSFIDHPDFPKLNQALAEIAEREHVSKAAVAIAWILRHPAHMQAIIGTMNPEHVADACAAAGVTLSHHDWYALYLAAGKYLP